MQLTRIGTALRRYAPYPSAHAAPSEAGLSAAARRHQAAMRRGALGAIVAGVALFVFNTVSTAFATPAAHHAAAPAAHPAAAAAPTGITAAPVLATTAPLQTMPAAPVLVSKTAPATPQVISGLAANGIPNVALNAYRVAAARMHNVEPGCGIDWALLAGIGREESDHGRFGGAVLHTDGTSSPRIIGPALDGKHWDYIPAPSDGQALDGDSVYAHALGPMQFIPSTWAEYGVDGNGDGKADIFNIYDAALTAARYLCAAGGDLNTQAGQVRAVLAYNHNNEYLAQVLALAQAYRTGVKVTGIPVGNVTGALPPVQPGSGTPPANPGGPTAVQPSQPSGGSQQPAPAASRAPAGGGATPAPGASSSSASPTRTPTLNLTGTHTSAPVPTPTPTPTPSPTPTCQLNLLKICVVK